jgi:sugar/nucleoside kinase (ribokinase family)
MGAGTRGRGESVEAIVAGHMCLDIIPEMPHSQRGFAFRPGTLASAGPAAISTGGCVPNTGLALHRLGARVSLMGKVGDDPFGRMVEDALRRVDGALARGLLVAPGEHTSYSVVLSPPDEDRMILHFPGANDTFEAGDLPEEQLSTSGARLFHFGYPPIMRKMYEDGGGNLALVLGKARKANLTTSLDMSYPDPASPAGSADWRQILEGVLPSVDVFVPSLEETLLMLDPEGSRELLAGGSSALEGVSTERVSALGGRLISMGAAIVGLKCGERGLYLRTASEQRLAGAGPGAPRASEWAGRELWGTVFEVESAGTTGAGDATAAGFLFALLRGMSPEEAVTAACAAGASSVEAPDATSGVAHWKKTRERIERGWYRREGAFGDGWSGTGIPGVWTGPGDARRLRAADAR